MKILFTGGGTIGSVTPLLALAEELNNKFLKLNIEYQFLWLGTKNGPERELIANYQIPFQAIFAGKLRRYFDFRNFIDPLFVFLGFIQSFWILLKFKPSIILSAGSFVSLPVILAGWLLRISSLVHQQDIKPSLTNKLMTPFVSRITVTFEKSLKDFPAKKTIWTGSPARKEILEGDRERGMKVFNLEKDLPVVLVLGGGTGALELNKIILKIVEEITKFCQIIHLTGRGKFIVSEFKNARYHPYEFLVKKMKDAYAVADLIICRAGIGTFTELAALKKPAILIPLPYSHQEKNARFFKDHKAVVTFFQNELKSRNLIEKIKEILENKEGIRDSLKENIQKFTNPKAGKKITEEILKIIGIKEFNTRLKTPEQS